MGESEHLMKALPGNVPRGKESTGRLDQEKQKILIFRDEIGAVGRKKVVRRRA